MFPNPHDAAESIDATNPLNVRYWAEKLELTEVALVALMEIHGRGVGDLRRAIQAVVETSEIQRSV